MEQHTITAPLGFPAPILPDAPAAREVRLDTGPTPAGGWVDLVIDVEEPAGADPASAAGPATAPANAAAPHAIPDLPRPPAPPTPFAVQVALLAAVALAVGVIAMVAARPPPAPAASFAPAAPAPRAELAPPLAPAPDVVPAPPRSAPAARGAMRARPVPIRRVAVPVEIGASATSPSPGAPEADGIPQPVAAPRLVPARDGDQSMSEPPLTGT